MGLTGTGVTYWLIILVPLSCSGVLEVGGSDTLEPEKDGALVLWDHVMMFVLFRRLDCVPAENTRQGRQSNGTHMEVCVCVCVCVANLKNDMK